jgi:putative transposase
MPKSAQPGAKAALAEIAEDLEHATKAVKAFETAYGTKWPKAVAKITDDLDVLLEFYDFPAEHWVHLRTTNPIESTFATVRLRQRVAKGPGYEPPVSRWRFNPIDSAEQRWRAVNAPHLVPLVRAGATFHKGKLVERPDDKKRGESRLKNLIHRS